MIRLTDEALAKNARESDFAMEELLERYGGLIKSLVRGYRVPGYEPEDLMQEGRWAVCEAVKSFDPAMGVKFSTYASLLIRRRAADALKKAAREKRLMPGMAVSLDGTPFCEGGLTYAETVGGQSAGPEEKTICAEQAAELSHLLANNLSAYEFAVLRGYLAGLSYRRIAEYINRAGNKTATEKTIDNAMQRIKKKLIPLLSEKRSGQG